MNEEGGRGGGGGKRNKERKWTHIKEKKGNTRPNWKRGDNNKLLRYRMNEQKELQKKKETQKGDGEGERTE